MPKFHPRGALHRLTLTVLSVLLREFLTSHGEML